MSKPRRKGRYTTLITSRIQVQNNINIKYKNIADQRVTSTCHMYILIKDSYSSLQYLARSILYTVSQKTGHAYYVS